jgi:hypothetical protein
LVGPVSNYDLLALSLQEARITDMSHQPLTAYGFNLINNIIQMAAETIRKDNKKSLKNVC